MVNEVTEWFEKRLDEIAEFNPRESLSKGNIAKKISMDKLQPFCRDVIVFLRPVLQNHSQYDIC